MKQVSILILSLFTIVTINCKKPSKPIPEKKVFSPRADLTDAKAVFYTNETFTTKGNFYKILNSNEIKRIDLINTDGTTIYENPREAFLFVYKYINANKFLLIDNYNSKLWDNEGKIRANAGLSVIEKSTGKIFDISENISNSISSIQTYNNNFYFLDYSKIYKITQTYSQSEEVSTYNNDDVNEYSINNDGFILYSSTSNNFYLKKPTGDIIPLDTEISGNIKYFWLGNDNSFYIYRTGTNTNNYIDKIDTNNSSYTITNIIEGIDFYGGFSLSSAFYLKVKLNNRVLFINKLSKGAILFSETLQNTDNAAIYFPEYENAFDVKKSADHFYLATEKNIFKFDFDFNYEALFNNNEFEIYAMAVDTENNVIFSAKRISNNKPIIGTVSSSNNVQIIDETLDRHAFNLEFL